MIKNLKRKAKHTCVKIAEPIFNILGFARKNKSNPGHYSKNYLLDTCFHNLKSMGFSPKHIVDVGANHGTWTRETLRHFPDSYYTLIEPQKWLQSSFQDLLDAYPKITFIPAGAGAKAGSFKFTIVDRDDSCSFRYTQEEAAARGYKQLDIPVIPLNDLAGIIDRPFPDLVKIDAEGLDLEVLKGAESLFGKTEVFMVEAGVFMKKFENSIINVINFMDKNGYRLFDITDLNRPFTPAVLWLVELAFVKKNGMIDSREVRV